MLHFCTYVTFPCAKIKLPIYQNQIDLDCYYCSIAIIYRSRIFLPKIFYFNLFFGYLTQKTKANKRHFLTESAPPSGERDKFSTVALSSSTLADIGAEPLFNGFIST